MTLTQYLSQLNSSDNQWGIWADPDDLEDYRIGQICFENGGMKDEKKFIGTLDNFSSRRMEYCGSFYDFVKHYCSINDSEKNAVIEFQGRKVKFNRQSMAESVANDSVDMRFYSALYAEYEKTCEFFSAEWAGMEVENILNQLAIF